ncbi:uncharacterized protein LOC128239401 isoform X1 [Mya arenaria]|uniref:uncharacterized protein LOC128239401 isoform X1 n=1 Tax=Mya arenaria TaxID=6604 RepID=UPI0022E6B5C5|nr:uncharacterized protein LOC128239401 isoform X1 [Mya arenaria]
METEGKGNFEWLFPDILTRDQLVDVLKKRYINTDKVEDLSKDELVSLYTEYIIPLPQRKYRLNRRGREMTKRQILAAKKRRISHPDDADTPLHKRPVTCGSVSSVDLPSVKHDRLKPPPIDCINSGRKTIKLNQRTALDVSPTLNNLQINNKNLDLSAQHNSRNKSKELVNFDKSSQVTLSTADTGHDPATGGHCPMDTEDSQEAPPVKKKKITKVSWP